MATMLRLALENEEAGDEEKTVVMQGPLADVYKKALDIAYAKPDPVTGEPAIATESQAIDAMVAKALAEAISKQQEGDTPRRLTVYGVSKIKVGQSDIVNVAKTFADENTNPDDFFVVIDATTPSVNGSVGGETQEYIEYGPVLESMVLKMGGKLFHSLEELVEEFDAIDDQGEIANDKHDDGDPANEHGSGDE